MSSTLASNSLDSINEILASIKGIIEEKNEELVLEQAEEKLPKSSSQYALNSYLSQADYLVNNHPNFKKHEYKGGEVLTIDDAIDNLARQIGITETSMENEIPNFDNLNNLSNFVESTAKPNLDSFDSSDTEKLILQSAMEEANDRLRLVISKWFQENLPVIIKKIIHEEMTKVLQNIKL